MSCNQCSRRDFGPYWQIIAKASPSHRHKMTYQMEYTAERPKGVDRMKRASPLTKRAAKKFWKDLEDTGDQQDVIRNYVGKQGYGSKRTLERWAQAFNVFQKGLSDDQLAGKGWSADRVARNRSWFLEIYGTRGPSGNALPVDAEVPPETSLKTAARTSVGFEAHVDALAMGLRSWPVQEWLVVPEYQAALAEAYRVYGDLKTATTISPWYNSEWVRWGREHGPKIPIWKLADRFRDRLVGYLQSAEDLTRRAVEKAKRRSGLMWERDAPGVLKALNDYSNLEPLSGARGLFNDDYWLKPLVWAIRTIEGYEDEKPTVIRMEVGQQIGEGSLHRSWYQLQFQTSGERVAVAASSEELYAAGVLFNGEGDGWLQDQDVQHFLDRYQRATAAMGDLRIGLSAVTPDDLRSGRCSDCPEDAPAEKAQSSK